MSDSERVRVPTNGHRPPTNPATETSQVDPPPPAEIDVPVGLIDDQRVGRMQYAVGFAILAALILLALGRRKRRG